MAEHHARRIATVLAADADLELVLDLDFVLDFEIGASAEVYIVAPVEALEGLAVTDIDTDRAASGSLAFAAKVALAGA